MTALEQFHEASAALAELRSKERRVLADRAVAVRQLLAAVGSKRAQKLLGVGHSRLYAMTHQGRRAPDAPH